MEKNAVPCFLLGLREADATRILHEPCADAQERKDVMGTLAVGAAVAGMVALIVRSMIRDKKNGKSLQCSGDCKNCGGHCR